MAFDEFAEERDAEWQLARWEHRPALVSRNGKEKRRYSGQTFNTIHFELVDRAWDHDHCQNCYATISTDGYADEIQEAYTDGTRWLCPSCFDRMTSSNNHQAT